MWTCALSLLIQQETRSKSKARKQWVGIIRTQSSKLSLQSLTSTTTNCIKKCLKLTDSLSSLPQLGHTTISSMKNRFLKCSTIKVKFLLACRSDSCLQRFFTKEFLKTLSKFLESTSKVRTKLTLSRLGANRIPLVRRRNLHAISKSS